MPTFLKKGVFELERVFWKRNPFLFLAFSSDLDLASIEALLEIIALEVIGSTLRVDTVRGEFKT